jgi:hypothetical protein
VSRLVSNSAMPLKLRRTRFDITVSADTLTAVDDFRFATRAPNRAQAVRRLLKAGLSENYQMAFPVPGTDKVGAGMRKPKAKQRMPLRKDAGRKPAKKGAKRRYLTR